MESEYRIECEECDSITIVLVDDGGEPEFCPCCGRRSQVENISENDDI